MWTEEPWLYHSLISSSLNLKLLNPRDAVEAAEKAYREGHAPIQAVEGFIRQILGWREYVRGIYWLKMPEYLERNVMQAEEPLPDFFWTGETDLECLRQAIGQTLEHGYAHHIQRLMVTGLYALLLGVNPKEVHAWYLAVYVDAVEWVELPNSLGMSQYADGGLMASKPYIATGKYIQKMSNYCTICPKEPTKRTGPDACPFSTSTGTTSPAMSRLCKRISGCPCRFVISPASRRMNWKPFTRWLVIYGHKIGLPQLPPNETTKTDPRHRRQRFGWPCSNGGSANGRARDSDPFAQSRQLSLGC